MIIYKYLSPRRTDVLKHQYLRCTSANNLNDIFELRPYFERIIDNSQKSELFDGVKIDMDQYLGDIYKSLPQEIKNKHNLNSLKGIFTKILNAKIGEEIVEKSKNFAVNYLNEHTKEIQDELYKTNIKLSGIISFSNINDSDLMWGIYSDSHKGYQIGFNSDHNFFNRPRTEDDEYFRIRKVVYDSQEKIKSLYGTEGVSFLARKPERWEFENEWRMLVPLFLADKVIKGEEEDIHLVKFPTDCIETIIFGARCNNKLKESILNIAHYKKLRHVKIGQMYVNPNDPKLNVQWLTVK